MQICVKKWAIDLKKDNLYLFDYFQKPIIVSLELSTEILLEIKDIELRS